MFSSQKQGATLLTPILIPNKTLINLEIIYIQLVNCKSLHVFWTFYVLTKNLGKVGEKQFIMSLSMKDIEDIYFFEVNTKYISSSVLKTSEFHECAARMKILMFSTHEMKYTWYLLKKVNFLFILIWKIYS